MEFIAAFSIIRNLEMIISSKQPPNAINCFNGIRVISMSWIILRHIVMPELVLNLLKTPNNTIKYYQSQFYIPTNCEFSFSVDSFFFMSGVLAAYLYLIEIQKREERFPVLIYYLHRYLRLTTVYAFVLFFWWTLTVHLGCGGQY